MLIASLLGVVGIIALGEPMDTVDEIRKEATMRRDTAVGNPLPLASHWITGSHKFSKGWGLKTQLKLIDEGQYILPWSARLKTPEEREAVTELAKRKLPFTLVNTEWEYLLSKPPYINLSEKKNPNVITVDGKARKMVSPFGPVSPWREVGKHWTTLKSVTELEKIYPDPPLVVFLSNNEHSKLRWNAVEISKRYLRKYGTGRSYNLKNKVIIDGWAERYRALQSGMRQGLTNENWRKHAIFIAYGGGVSYLGRWGGWRNYAQYLPGMADPMALTWDGASESFYTLDTIPITDFRMWSPQIEFMNDVFIQKEYYRINPNFWFELSVWDGHQKGLKTDKKKFYENLGQKCPPERYAGMVQFGMWLLRPRVVREWRSWTMNWDEYKALFMEVVKSCDRVHRNPVLRKWWRKGTLVANKAHKHPYQTDIPDEIKEVGRWFLLDADVNPQEYPWESFWTVNVYALALTMGEAPSRKWLVYAHSPLQNRKSVELTVPGYGKVKVDVTVGGSFYELDEKTRKTKFVTSSKEGEK